MCQMDKPIYGLCWLIDFYMHFEVSITTRPENDVEKRNDTKTEADFLQNG